MDLGKKSASKKKTSPKGSNKPSSAPLSSTSSASSVPLPTTSPAARSTSPRPRGDEKDRLPQRAASPQRATSPQRAASPRRGVSPSPRSQLPKPSPTSTSNKGLTRLDSTELSSANATIVSPAPVAANAVVAPNKLPPKKPGSRKSSPRSTVTSSAASSGNPSPAVSRTSSLNSTTTTITVTAPSTLPSAPSSSKLIRVSIPERAGGGFITLNVDDISHTVDTVKKQILAKIEAKRVQTKISGQVKLRSEDFKLALIDESSSSASSSSSSTQPSPSPAGERTQRSNSLSRTLTRSNSNVSANPPSSSTGRRGSIEDLKINKMLDDDAVAMKALPNGKGPFAVALIPSEAEGRQGSTTEVRVSGIKTIHGRFIASGEESGVGSGMFALTTRPDIHPSTNFRIIMENEDSSGVVYVQDYKDRYLTADDRGNVYLAVEKGSWARWWAEEGEYFKSTHGKYLTAHPKGTLHTDGKGSWGRMDPCGRVVEGNLKKKASGTRLGSRWQSRFFRLAEHHLMYWHSESDARAYIASLTDNTVAGSGGGKYAPNKDWPTQDLRVSVVKEKGAKFEFEVTIRLPAGTQPSPSPSSATQPGTLTHQASLSGVGDGNTIVLQLMADNQDECNVWVEALEKESSKLLPSATAADKPPPSALTSEEEKLNTMAQSELEDFSQLGTGQLIELLKQSRGREKKFREELSRSEDGVVAQIFDKELETQRMKKELMKAQKRCTEVQADLNNATQEVDKLRAEVMSLQVGQEVLTQEEHDELERMKSANKELLKMLSDKNKEIERLKMMQEATSSASTSLPSSPSLSLSSPGDAARKHDPSNVDESGSGGGNNDYSSSKIDPGKSALLQRLQRKEEELAMLRVSERQRRTQLEDEVKAKSEEIEKVRIRAKADRQEVEFQLQRQVTDWAEAMVKCERLEAQLKTLASTSTS